MQWFITVGKPARHPSPTTALVRRAAALSLLIGGMADNLNPKIMCHGRPSSLSEHWLPELHYDSDGDGLPQAQSRHPKDGFATFRLSHCHGAKPGGFVMPKSWSCPKCTVTGPDARHVGLSAGTTWMIA